MKKILFAFVLLILLTACAGVPVRKALKEDLAIPAGRVEGNQFTGIRYPFRVSAPPPWKISTEFPDFLQELGYDRPSSSDREQTEVYIFNPETHSSIQIDFTPAGRYAVFSQEGIERLTTSVTGILEEEVKEEYGKRVQVTFGPTEPYSLKGVTYAAREYATYTVNGVKREQGWIYGFTEPYQIFILYMILEKEGSTDHQDMKKILDSFQYLSPK
jgi:hypothetical protein